MTSGIAAGIGEATVLCSLGLSVCVINDFGLGNVRFLLHMSPSQQQCRSGSSVLWRVQLDALSLHETVSTKHPLTLGYAVYISLSNCHNTKQCTLFSASNGWHSSIIVSGTHEEFVAGLQLGVELL